MPKISVLGRRLVKNSIQQPFKLMKYSGIALCLFAMQTTKANAMDFVKPYSSKTNMDTVPTNAQIAQISGTVVDTSGNALIGVSIRIKGSSKGTFSSAGGQFKLDAPANSTLTFSYIGFLEQEIALAGKTTLNVVLVPEDKSLNEVVVVGYGTQKKVDLSGSVSTVDKEVLVNRPTTSLTNALQGTTPGLAIMNRPGDVGNDVGTVNVLGRGNLGTSSPLFVVDGVPVSSGDFARINPNDVASISVLKDASAASIYGSRAAYGVILVTTKQGEKGKMAVHYNGYYGVQTPTVLPDYVGAYDYALLRNEAAINGGASAVYSDKQLEMIKNQTNPDLYPDNDWYQLVLRDQAPITSHEINVSGGGATRYFLSGSYFQQNSILPGKDLKRYSLRANTQSQVSDHFKIGTNVSYIRDGYNNDNGSISWVSMNRMVPMMVNKQSNGDWGSVNAGQIDGTLAADNPLRTLQEGGRQYYHTDRFIGQVDATFTPIKGLDIKGLVSYNLLNQVNSVFNNRMSSINNFFTGKPISGTAVTPNKLTEEWSRNGRFLAQATASYDKTINKHHGTLLVGTSFEDYNTRFIKVIRKDFVNNSLGSINGGSTDPINTEATGNIQESRLSSVFGCFNYAYDGKYLFQANLRVDGSSQFAPGHRWGVYPSFSAAWRISQENFLQSSEVISNLKLRASWGKLGNINNVGYYDFYDAINTGSAVILGQSQQDGAWPGKIANPTLSWEKVDMFNVGVDGGLWNNKLTFQLDVFNKLTHGILQSNPSLPDEMGLTDKQTPVVNIAEVSNKGFEFNLTYKNNIGDFHYAIGGNFTRIWNNVEKLSGDNVQPTGDFWVNAIGQPIGSFYMYQAEGLFVDSADVKNHAFQSVSTGPGDIKYKDINGDNKIDGKDRTIVGSDVPYKYYGLNITASYKNFDLSVIGQGVMGVSVYLQDEASWAFFNGSGAKSMVLDRWTTANPNASADYPRILTSDNNTQNQVSSSFWLYNANYFRIKSLSIGYTMPSAVLSSLKIQNLRFYLASNNPFTIRGDKRMKDFDPESASARGSYPQMKSFIIGANLTF